MANNNDATYNNDFIFSTLLLSVSHFFKQTVKCSSGEYCCSLLHEPFAIFEICHRPYYLRQADAWTAGGTTEKT